MTYQVLPSTSVHIKRIDSEWTGQNIDPFRTTRLNEFDEQDLVLDPNRVYAPIQNTHQARVEARRMQCGYYGFERDGWLVLVDSKLVIRRKSC